MWGCICVIDKVEKQKTLLVVYHSQSGACARLAKAVWQGARQEVGVEIRLCRVWDATVEDLQACDALVILAAENSGALSGGAKDFLDRTLYPAIDRQLVKPAAVVISAGNDGRNARVQIKRILSGFPFPLVQEPLICRGDVSAAMEADCVELGQAVAAGLLMGIF